MGNQNDILAIVDRLEGLVSEPLSDDNPIFSQSPAVKVMNSVLSLGMNFDSFIWKLMSKKEATDELKKKKERAFLPIP